MTASQFVERQNLTELLKSGYEILGGLVRRWAVWERAGAHDLLRRPESSSIAVDLCRDTIPYLRQRLGLAPDPNLNAILKALQDA